MFLGSLFGFINSSGSPHASQSPAPPISEKLLQKTHDFNTINMLHRPGRNPIPAMATSPCRHPPSVSSTYYDPSLSYLSISSIKPASGRPGTIVTLTGSGFYDLSVVDISTSSCTFYRSPLTFTGENFSSSTQLTFSIPLYLLPGTYNILVENPVSAKFMGLRRAIPSSLQ
jgi:hypothetical protein